LIVYTISVYIKRVVAERRSRNPARQEGSSGGALGALSILQYLDHRWRSKDSRGFVLLQGEEFLIAGHQELGLACFGQREQITVFGIRRDRAQGEVPAKKREVPKTRGEQLGRADAKSRPEKRPAGDSAQFRYELVTGDKREPLALPSVDKLGRGAQWRQKSGEQEVGIEDEAHQERWARSR